MAGYIWSNHGDATILNQQFTIDQDYVTTVSLIMEQQQCYICVAECTKKK